MNYPTQEELEAVFEESHAAALAEFEKHRCPLAPVFKREVASRIIDWYNAQLAKLEPVGEYIGNGVIGWRGEYSMHEATTPKKVDVGTKLYAAPMPAQAPGGWKMVPVEPTATMIYMMVRATDTLEERIDSYKATLAAAPVPPNVASDDAKDAARLGVICEVQVISQTYDRVRSERQFAIDDLEYDLFAAGWKAAIDALKGGE